MNTEKRGRGRPRKNFISGNNYGSEKVASSSEINDIEIDKTDFEFFESNNSADNDGQFNPLADTPIRREYATPKIQEGLQGDIIEPTFHQQQFANTQPTFTAPSVENQSKSESSSSKSSPPPSGGAKNPNPQFNDIDDAEKKVACEQMVDAMLDLYDTAWALGGRLAQVSEEKIQGMVNDGSLDPQKRIPVENTSVSIFEFFQNYNNQVVEASKVDNNFKKKVRPPLVRVFMKNGWGMTDEQFLGVAFAKDSIIRTFSLYQMKKSINALIQELAEERVVVQTVPKSKQKPNNPTPPPPPPPRAEPEIITPEADDIFDDDDFYDEDELNKVVPPPPPSPKNTEKYDINFGDNPLRQDSRREPPAPKVEETFIKGGEIIDEPKDNNETT